MLGEGVEMPWNLEAAESFLVLHEAGEVIVIRRTASRGCLPVVWYPFVLIR